MSKLFLKALNRTVDISSSARHETHADSKYSMSFRIPLTPLTIEAVGSADVQWYFND